MKILDQIENQIIRPSEIGAWFRTQENMIYVFEDGYNKGLSKIEPQIDSKRDYKKCYDSTNFSYYITKNHIIVNKNEFNLEGIEYADLKYNRAIITKTSYFKLMGFTLNEQFQLWVRTEYTDNMISHPDFFNTLKRKIKAGKGIEFLKNFYYGPDDIDKLYYYDDCLTLSDKAKLLNERKKILLDEIENFSIDLKFLDEDISDLKKKINQTEKALEKNKKSTTARLKLEKKISSLIDKKEKLLKKSIYTYIEDLDKKLADIDSKLSDISSIIEKEESDNRIFQNILSDYIEKLETSINARRSLLERIKKDNELLSSVRSDLISMIEEEVNSW